jgi:hypothetical protein
VASNLNIILSGATLQVINNTDSSTRVNSSLGSPTLGGSESTYIDFLPIAVGPTGTVLTLPAATIWVLCVRNLGGTNSTPSGNIQVQFTVTGGTQIALASSPIILPNGVFAYWNTAETAGGITAITLVASVANTPAEILMAA